MVGLSALIALNAVVFSLIYGTTQRILVLFMRGKAAKSFVDSVLRMWMLSMFGVVLGVLYMVWQPDEMSKIGQVLWIAAATCLIGTLVSVPVVAFLELLARKPISADEVDKFLAKKSKSRSRKRHSSDGLQLLRVRARGFEGNRQDPFEDVLGHRRIVEAVCRAASDIASSTVLLVDGEWGSGKTAFTRMCVDLLRSESFKGWDGTVIEFNAWTQSYTGEPLRDLVSALTKKINGDDELHDMLEDLLRDRLLLKAAFDVAADPFLLPRRELGTETAKFKEVLAAFVDSSNESDKRIVVFVDELDRCMPDHALRMLETVRNLFDMDGVTVVVTVNLEALEHAVASLLGLGCDAERYLQRFFDMRVALPAPQSKDLQRFYKHLLEQTGFDERFKGEESDAKHILGLLAAVHSSSLRDLEQAVHRAVFLLASIGPGSANANSSVTEVWEQTALVLLVFREVDRKAYEDFVHGYIDGFTAAIALEEALRRLDIQDFTMDSGGAKELPSELPALLYQMEALLLNISQDGLFVVLDENLASRYEAHKRSAYWPHVQERLRSVRLKIEKDQPDLQELADLIELTAHEPRHKS